MLDNTYVTMKVYANITTYRKSSTE